MTSSTVKLIALAAVLSMVLTTVPVAAADGLAVSTGNASDVGETSATVSGNLTDVGTADTVNVSFEYWEEGDMENSSETSNQTLSAPGEFNATLSGLNPNTTYEYRARASTGDEMVVGEAATFTTDETLGMTNPFGLQVVSFIRSLGGDEMVGPAVSNWVTTNNPGSDHRPDSAGPDDQIFAKILANQGSDAANTGSNGQGPPTGVGPQADAGNTTNTTDVRGPPEDKGNDNNNSGSGTDDTSEEDDVDEEDDESS